MIKVLLFTLSLLTNPVQSGMNIKHPLFIGYDDSGDIICCVKKFGRYQNSSYGSGCVVIPKQNKNLMPMCVCKCTKKGKAACYCYDFDKRKHYYINWPIPR